jgi:Na+/proline symporter
LFASYYGTKYVDASEKRHGIVTAVAIESILKLVSLLIIGIYVTYFVFDGFDDIYVKAALLDNFDKKNTIGGLAQGMNWFFFAFYRCLLSFFYPDNFILQLLKIIAKTYSRTMAFPIVFITFNIFVFPIVWAATSF